MYYLSSKHLKYISNFRLINFTYRKSSSFLINDNKYSFLKELGLKEENVGVYDGKWDANGSVSTFKYFYKLSTWLLF